MGAALNLQRRVQGPEAMCIARVAGRGAHVGIDWRNPAPVDLGDGRTIAGCEGDGPLLCVSDRGRHAGVLEILDFPLHTVPQVQRALRQHGERHALRVHAAAFLHVLGTDRAEGCGRAYRFRPESRRLLYARDGRVIRYGFTGEKPTGRAVWSARSSGPESGAAA